MYYILTEQSNDGGYDMFYVLLEFDTKQAVDEYILSLKNNNSSMFLYRVISIIKGKEVTKEFK